MHSPNSVISGVLIAFVAVGSGLARAQIPPPNTAGVAMGHLHYFVSDIEASKAFWISLGGTPGTYEAGELVRFPGFVVLLSESEGESDGGEQASVVDHVAFRIESLAAIEAAGIELRYLEQFPGIALARTPEGERVELFEQGVATNVGFDIAAGYDDTVAERHNRPLSEPIASHHLHLYVPEGEVMAARDWYVEHFGATPGTRWRYAAADVPGMNFNFSAASGARVATEGRPLEHIGFEIDNLQAFCNALEAKGIELDQPYEQLPSGFAFAVLTDPWGTRIELTDGLRDL